MRHTITVVGIGPGDPAYLLPQARAAIHDARVLVGGRRALADLAPAGVRTHAIGADIVEVLTFIRDALRDDDVVVMVSGDPGYYSMLDALRRTFPPEQMAVIPGISSLQFAFARLALPWHDTRLLSFHGREPQAEELARTADAVLGMLTDGKHNSQTIAQRLLSSGWRADDMMYIATRLSYADENIVRTTLGDAARDEGIGHGVIIVCAVKEDDA